MFAVLLGNCIMPACANASYCAFGSLGEAKLQRLGWRSLPEQNYHALERKESISPILKLHLLRDGLGLEC